MPFSGIGLIHNSFPTFINVYFTWNHFRAKLTQPFFFQFLHCTAAGLAIYACISSDQVLVWSQLIVTTLLSEQSPHYLTLLRFLTVITTRNRLIGLQRHEVLFRNKETFITQLSMCWLCVFVPRPERTTDGLTLVCVNPHQDGLYLMDKALSFVTVSIYICCLLYCENNTGIMGLMPNIVL